MKLEIECRASHAPDGPLINARAQPFRFNGLSRRRRRVSQIVIGGRRSNSRRRTISQKSPDLSAASRSRRSLSRLRLRPAEPSAQFAHSRPPAQTEDQSVSASRQKRTERSVRPSSSRRRFWLPHACRRARATEPTQRGHPLEAHRRQNGLARGADQRSRTESLGKPLICWRRFVLEPLVLAQTVPQAIALPPVELANSFPRRGSGGQACRTHKDPPRHEYR